MSFELAHAWADRGLDEDGPGFVVVVRTEGLPRAIERIAVACSGHRLPEDDRATLALRRFERPDGTWAMLTATTPDEGDPARSRRVAHHLVLDELDLRRSDLAGTVAAWRPMRSFDGRIESREAPPRLPSIAEVPPEPASAWQRALGDAAWAGETLARIRTLGDETLVVLLPGSADVAALAADLLGLLPPPERSRLTFADRLRRSDVGLRLVLLDEHAVGIAEKPLPGGAALMDLRDRKSHEGSAAPSRAEAGTSRSDASFFSIERERREVQLGDVESRPIEPSVEWTGPIEVRLEEKGSNAGRWMLLAAAAAVVLLMAAVAFASSRAPGEIS